MNRRFNSIALCTVVLMLYGPVALTDGLPAPEISAEQWLNVEPLTTEALRGQVVLVEFWTFDCWNCKNVEPYIKRWHEAYESEGLVVLAVHSPEFQHERDIGNVQRYIEKNAIDYPVPIDNDFSIWKAFKNRAWPTIYLIDKSGQIVYSHIGEGGYDRTESKIRELLAHNVESG